MMPDQKPKLEYGTIPKHRLGTIVFTAACFLSGLLCILCGIIGFSSYHHFVEGTVNAQSQIIHDPWLAQTAKLYAVASGVLGVVPLVKLFMPIKKPN